MPLESRSGLHSAACHFERVTMFLHINVNDHTEKKNGLTYLSWAWAWAEVLKVDSEATWTVHEYNGLPFMRLPDESAIVKTTVVIKGVSRDCLLPVMDHRNKAIKNPDAFAVNTAIMRCMTKAISMHGLGLYIYAGEDIPQAESPEQKAEREAKEKRGAELDELALHLIDCHSNGKDIDAIRIWNAADTWSSDVEDKQAEQLYVWGHLKTYPKLRSVIKANKPEQKAA